MSATLRAQLWELGRMSWLELLTRLACIFVVAIMMTYVSYQLGRDDPGVAVARGHVLMTLLIYGIFCAAVNYGLFGYGFLPGPAFRLGFTRPILTTQLVVVPMLFNVMAAVLCFLLPAALFAIYMRTTFPMLGPSALLACMVTCFIASIWSSETALGRWAGFVLSGSALVLVLKMIDLRSAALQPYSVRSGTLEYWQLPWTFYAGLALLAGAAIAFTVLAVDRQRHGDSIGISIPLIKLARRTPARHGGAAQTFALRPFRNQWTAQCWYEFARTWKFLLLPVLIMPCVVVSFVGVNNHLDPDLEACVYCFASSLVVCPLVIQLLGTVMATGLRNKDGVVAFPAFDGTCPMRCDHLVAAKLMTVTLWSMAEWLLIAAGAIFYAPYIGDGSALAKVGELLSMPAAEASVYWWAAAAVSVSPLLICTTPMMLAYPYSVWVRAAMGMIVLIHFPMVVIETLGIWSFRPLWIAYIYLVPALIVLLCVFVLCKSLKSAFVGKRYLLASLAIWTLITCTTVSLAIHLLPAAPLPASEQAYFIFASVLLIPLASTAGAPMALAERRHA